MFYEKHSEISECYIVKVDANLRLANRLRQSIRKQAFSGQLVPQDPDDEPASVLLERIQRQQAAPVKATREKPAPRRNARPAIKVEPKADTPDHVSLDSVLTAILDLMQPGREYFRADLADTLGLSTGRWNAAIQELKRRGQVRQVGEKRGARYFLK
jgi:type I restriction enzyme S subunit